MRAPFQILAIPYKFIDGEPFFCVFCRSDSSDWQFVAGGGEDSESAFDAARREIFEEIGVEATTILKLKSMCYIPADIFPKRKLYNWPDDMYVIPEYSFAFRCDEKIKLSCEHSDFRWLTYNDAVKILKWDSNKTALYELNCRLKDEKSTL